MEQLSIFDYDLTGYSINQPIRLIELFAGVGSQAMALRNIGANFEHYRVVEFDKYAIKSYNAIHGTDFPTMDITQISGKDLGIVKKEKYCYIMTYSFPCQDLSLAGKGKGMAKGSGTRSGLLWEVERLLNEVEHLPQILLMENVTQVHGKKNKEHFEKWIKFLSEKGYSNFWQDMNAKEYGVPQNRNRCFMVSILGDWKYKFPETIELKLRLKDILEEKVDEKYYLKNTPLLNIKGNGINVKEATKKGYAEATEGDSINMEQPNSKTRRGRVGHGVAQTLTTMPNQAVLEPQKKGDFVTLKYKQFIDKNGYIPEMFNPYNCSEIKNAAPAQSTVCDHITTSATVLKAEIDRLRIRKLTPKECWRLMGFQDKDFEKAQAVNSNTQLYKQAGNSIVVNCLEAIFRNLNIQNIPTWEEIQK